MHSDCFCIIRVFFEGAKKRLNFCAYCTKKWCFLGRFDWTAEKLFGTFKKVLDKQRKIVYNIYVIRGNTNSRRKPWCSGERYVCFPKIHRPVQRSLLNLGDSDFFIFLLSFFFSFSLYLKGVRCKHSLTDDLWCTLFLRKRSLRIISPQGSLF